MFVSGGGSHESVIDECTEHVPTHCLIDSNNIEYDDEGRENQN